jgi:hypothetical protein
MIGNKIFNRNFYSVSPVPNFVEIRSVISNRHVDKQPVPYYALCKESVTINRHLYLQRLLIVPTQWTTQTVKQATYRKPLLIIICVPVALPPCVSSGGGGGHILWRYNATFISGKPTRGESNSITITGRCKANVLAFTRWNVIWIVRRRVIVSDLGKMSACASCATAKTSNTSVKSPLRIIPARGPQILQIFK